MQIVGFVAILIKFLIGQGKENAFSIELNLDAFYKLSFTFVSVDLFLMYLGGVTLIVLYKVKKSTQTNEEGKDKTIEQPIIRQHLYQIPPDDSLVEEPPRISSMIAQSEAVV